MPLSIGTKKLIPAPLVGIQKQMIFTQDGMLLNSNYRITMNGTLIPNRGSPTSKEFYDGIGDPLDESFTTDEDRFNSILAKQELLKELLASTGYYITYSPPGNDPIVFYPSLDSLSFQQGTWVVKCDYQAELSAPSINRDRTPSDDLVYTSGTNYLNLTSVSDNYQIREKEDGTEILDVTRTISATAAFRYNNPSGNLEAWKNARTWVLSRKNTLSFNSGFIDVATGLVLTTGMVYNVVEEESIDQLAGQFSLSQHFIFHRQNYIETRTINRSLQPNRINDNGPSIENITINGSILGLDANNLSANKIANASGYWDTIRPTLGSYVGAYGSGTITTLDIDPIVGTIGYSMQFVNQTGSLYRHNYDVNYNLSNDLPNISINGTIEGITLNDYYWNTAGNPDKFANALTGWAAVSGNLKSLIFAHPELTPTGSLFSNYPTSKSISFNQANGVITYNFTYPYTSGALLSYQNSYTINLNTDNAPVNVANAGLICGGTIDGQIIGLSVNNSADDKMNNARTGWAAIKTNLYTLVNNEYSLLGANTPVLNSGFVRRTLGLDTRQGVISYSAAFANTPSPSSTQVAVEDITVEDVNASDVFAVQIIPGRLSGPIIQNIATSTERRRTINISLTMYPKSLSPYYWLYSDKSTPGGIASGIMATLVPAGTRLVDFYIAGDSENWNPKAGLYTRSVNIVY